MAICYTVAMHVSEAFIRFLMNNGFAENDADARRAVILISGFVITLVALYLFFTLGGEEPPPLPPPIV